MKKKKWLCVLMGALLLLSGCAVGNLAGGIKDESAIDIDSDSGSEEACAEVLLEIEHAEGAVAITVEDGGEFEGCEDRIWGTRVIPTGRTPLISSVSSCADYGGHFSGDYVVFGRERTLKNMTYCFAPPDQRYEAISCGVNYYDLIMRGEVLKCESIRIQYGKHIMLERVSGEFSMMIFPLSKHCPLRFSAQMITLNGSIEGSGTVSLIWDGDRFLFASEQPLLILEVTAGSANHMEEQSVHAEGGMNYEIRIADGAPVIQETGE